MKKTDQKDFRASRSKAVCRGKCCIVKRSWASRVNFCCREKSQMDRRFYKSHHKSSCRHGFELFGLYSF